MSEQYPGNQFGSNNPMQPQQPQQGWGQQAQQQAWNQQPQQGWGQPMAEQPMMVPGQQMQAPRKKHKGLVTGLVGAGVLALVAGGVALADPFDWRGGDQDVTAALPSSVLGMAMVDLDPSLSQKAEMVRFAMKFPTLKEKLSLSEDGDIKKQLWDAATKDNPCDKVNYDADIKPWLGDQFAMAATSDKKPLVAVEAKDESKAREGVKKMMSCSEGSNDKVGVAYIEGYLILSEDQAAADKAVADAKATPLSKNADFIEDFKALGATGIMSGWGTKEGMKVLAEQAESTSSKQLPGPAKDFDWGQADFRSSAFTLRFTDGNPEFKAVQKQNQQWTAPSRSTALGDLPADTKFAVGISGGSQLVDQVWPYVEKAIKDAGGDLSDIESQSKIKLPDDLKTILGEDIRLALGSFDFESMGSAPDQVEGGLALATDKAKLDDLLARTGLDQGGITVVSNDKTQGVAFSKEWAEKMANPSGGKLADQAAFKKAYPGGDKVQTALYVDLESLVKDLGGDMDAKVKQNLEPLQALAMTSSVEGDNYTAGSVRLTAK